MKKLLTFYFALFLISFGKAQHCPFDGVAIIVLNIHAADSVGVIPGLKIYMLDNTNQPVKTLHYENNEWVSDTAWFWQNPDKTTFKGYMDNSNPAIPEKIRFPFARNNYVTTTHYHFPASKYRIIIEDINCAKNRGAFMKQVISIHNTDVYPLCTTYNKEVYDYPYEKLTYKPVEVILQKK